MPSGSADNIIVTYASLIMIVGLGFLAAWMGMLKEDLITLISDLIMGLLLPIFTFYHSATGSVASVLNQAPWMILLGVGGGFAGYLLATLLARWMHWDWSRRSVLQVSGVSGNTGFFGVPVCSALFGSQGTILALLYDQGASIYLFTLGVGVFQKEEASSRSIKNIAILILKQLFNPLFISLLLGFGIALAGWQLPAFLATPMQSLSNTVVPLMMLVLGGLVYQTAVRNRIDAPASMLLIFLKLLILPVLTWLVICFLPVSGVARAVAIIQAGMPSAIISVTLAVRYKADENLAASVTMLTTLLSVITIPAFALVLK